MLPQTGYLSLNPEDPTPAGPGRFTMLTTPVYPALQYMAAGLRLEEVLLHVARACEGEGDPSLYGEETARSRPRIPHPHPRPHPHPTLTLTLTLTLALTLALTLTLTLHPHPHPNQARFVQHAFFCYDTSGVAGGQSVMPLNAVAEEDPFMMQP